VEVAGVDEGESAADTLWFSSTDAARDLGAVAVMRREVLVRHAQALGMTLNHDVLDYLLSRFSRDLGHLMDLLQRLDTYALQTQRPLTIPLLRAMLDEL
jgi:chromosomal replication initiation ATPase DnaA